MGQIQDSCCFLNQFINLILRSLSQLQTKCHVIVYSHMRIQSVVLEYHCDITVLRLYIIYELAVDVQLTGRNIFQTSDHTKGGRLTASRRSYEDDELLVCDFQVKIFYCNKSIRICFGYMSQ